MTGKKAKVKSNRDAESLIKTKVKRENPKAASKEQAPSKKIDIEALKKKAKSVEADLKKMEKEGDDEKGS